MLKIQSKIVYSVRKGHLFYKYIIHKLVMYYVVIVMCTFIFGDFAFFP